MTCGGKRVQTRTMRTAGRPHFLFNSHVPHTTREPEGTRQAKPDLAVFGAECRIGPEAQPLSSPFGFIGPEKRGPPSGFHRAWRLFLPNAETLWLRHIQASDSRPRPCRSPLTRPRRCGYSPAHLPSRIYRPAQGSEHHTLSERLHSRLCTPCSPPNPSRQLALPACLP